MFKSKIYLSFFFFACIWILNGCGNISSVSYQILHIEGVSWASNVSSSYVSFGSGTESGESGMVSLPVSDGDLLYVFNEDDLELYYRYKLEDGGLLSVSFDTMKTNSAYVNGSLAFFQVSNHPSSWDAFKGLSSSEVQQLSTLYLTDSITKELLDVLRVHETSIHGTGLVLGNESDGEALQELLSICRPEWLGLDGGLMLNEVTREKFLTDLELLWISTDIHAASSIIHCCTNLESLIITDWEPYEGELLPLSGLTNLHSLTLADCYLTDLSNFEFPSTLERLHLIGCDTLTDINGLNRFKSLTSLSLIGSDDIESLNVVNTLESLNWISFPENTTQEEFQVILNSLENLEVVELNNCTDVSDISQLQHQKHLKVLIFNSEDYDIEPLANLDQLKLMVLSNVLFDDSPELISRLRKELPHTEIVPGSGLCLGSGWLLLLLPLVLLFRILFRKDSRL